MDDQEMERFTCDDARAVFVRWEKLRLLYNVIVGLVGAAGTISFVFFNPVALRDGSLCGPPHIIARLDLIAGIVFYGIAANVCYLLGPILESYLRWLGLRIRHLTQTLFITGTVLSVLLTAFVSFLMCWMAILSECLD